ncbi:MAG: restriction endonuclease subunit S [Clostridia bacterium]|nr:restriction endonuclease subunit S [Clostridia bacterium]
MRKVAFRDVICRVKEIVDKDDTELEYYVGGEHFDCGEVQITKRGILQGSTIGPAFHMRFRPGDVLLMSRNPHLRKAGVVNFDGICSDVSYVCRTRDESILPQRLIPFIFQTEAFWSYATAHRHGSTNYFLNWKDFEGYEFKLPEGDQLHYITDLLWAYERLRRHYLSLIVATDDLVKSQFVEMLKPYAESGKVVLIQDMVAADRPVTYGIVKPGTNYEGGVPVVRVKDYTDGTIHTDDMLHTSPELNSKYLRSTLLKGDVLLSIGGTIGRVAIVPKELEGANITQHTARISLKQKYDPLFVKGVLESPIMQEVMQKSVLGVAQVGLNLKDIRLFPVPDLPQEGQKYLVEFYRQTDKSKLAIRQALESLEKSRTAIMNRIFG